MLCDTDSSSGDLCRCYQSVSGSQQYRAGRRDRHLHSGEPIYEDSDWYGEYAHQYSDRPAGAVEIWVAIYLLYHVCAGTDHVKTNILFLVFDSIVILASWIVFQDMTVAFYAGIAVVTDSIVMDKILYGSDEAKLVYIISEKPEQVKQRLFDELDTTATIITARGAYTNAPKEMLMIVTRKQMYPRLEEIVKDEDTSAFMIVSSASEIFGEGYKDITRDKI